MNNIPQQSDANSILFFHFCQYAIMSWSRIVIPCALNLAHLFKGYFLLQTSFLSCVESIVFNGAKKQVVWPTALPVIATVADKKSCWYFPIIQFPCYAACSHHSFLAIYFNDKLPISWFTERCHPIPATIVFLHLLPKSLCDRTRIFFSRMLITSDSPTSDRATANMTFAYALFSSRSIAANLANAGKRHTVTLGQLFKHRTGISAATNLGILSGFNSFVVRTSGHRANLSPLGAI